MKTDTIFAPLQSRDRLQKLLVCTCLILITAALYAPVWHHEFVNYDDNEYVTENVHVLAGLNWKNVDWAFTTFDASNWHPLTWVSHMLDVELWDGDAGGHHITSVLCHAVSAVLLFLVFSTMTGNTWRSAFIAAIFAWHPLHVESVAWVAERKDVLSGVFFMLTLWAYVRYARSDRRSPVRYLTVLVFFTLGLMCKPTLVTLPFVLLLLDYWPLRRNQPRKLSGASLGSRSRLRAADRSEKSLTWPALVAEKIPFFALSAAVCVATVLAQKEELKIITVPFFYRAGNALVSYVVYLGQMIWPVNLAVLYPYPVKGVPLREVVLAFILLAAISAGAYRARRKHPWFLVGWFWYLGMLVPVIGLVQVGSQARADRYTYLPLIGLSLLVTWAVAEISARWRRGRETSGIAALIALTALIVCARIQASYWPNSEILWRHALETTSDNYIAHGNLGSLLMQKGEVDEATIHFIKALEIKADYAEAHSNLGLALLQKGQTDEAIAHLQNALRSKPDYAEVHYNLGNALLQKEQVDEAIVHFQKALKIKPGSWLAYNNLGNAFRKKGEADEAIGCFRKALEITPENWLVYNNLGIAFLEKGGADEAIVQFHKALQIKPANWLAYNNLGMALLRKGQLDEAIACFQKALTGNPQYVEAYVNLGDALRQKGQVDQAIVHFHKALEIKPENVQAHYNLGNILAEQSKFDEAIEHYTEALRLNGNYPEGHFKLGYALLRSGHREEAVAHLTEALRLKPGYTEAEQQLRALGAPVPR